MSDHIDFVAEMTAAYEPYEPLLIQENDLPSGTKIEQVVLDCSKVRWAHDFKTQPIAQVDTEMAEIYDLSQPNNVAEEYFKATSNMSKSWILSGYNYKTNLKFDIPQGLRLRNYDKKDPREQLEHGFPQKIEFPHVGKDVFIKKSSIPLASNQANSQTQRIEFEKITYTAKCTVKTFFSKNVCAQIKISYPAEQDLQNSDSEDEDFKIEYDNLEDQVVDVNELLGRVLKRDGRSGRLYFESNGEIEIEVKRQK